PDQQLLLGEAGHEVGVEVDDVRGVAAGDGGGQLFLAVGEALLDHLHIDVGVLLVERLDVGLVPLLGRRVGERVDPHHDGAGGVLALLWRGLGDVGGPATAGGQAQRGGSGGSSAQSASARDLVGDCLLVETDGASPGGDVLSTHGKGFLQRTGRCDSGQPPASWSWVNVGATTGTYP